MFKFFLVIIFVFSLIFLPKEVRAIYEPQSTSNNKFGIHVIDTSDLREVSELVNSNGGDWGYVTIVIQKGERDPKRWQDAMDYMRRLHLIPIIRIATSPQGQVWEKPNHDEIDGWVNFLTSLNWVVKNRYIIIGNEPNHAKEWGGEIKPDEYSKYLKEFSQKLKNEDDDFYIMPAGFDASAPTSRNLTGVNATMDEGEYIRKMFEAEKQVFDFIDGWSSHSYPNPGFSGGGDGIGRGTVRTFEWELNYLKSLGFQKELPVFITETGWTHGIDSTETNIIPKIETAFKNAWNDTKIIAVTPFVYKYTQPPFDNFSWKNKEGKFYDFYYKVKDLPKTKGEPVQIVEANILTGIMPKIATSNSEYHSVLFVKNTGQSIWRINNLGAVDTRGNKLTIQSMIPETIEPEQIGVFLLVGRFPAMSGAYETGISLVSNNKIISNSYKERVNLIPGIGNFSQILDYLKALLWRRV